MIEAAAAAAADLGVRLRSLGLRDYLPVWRAMQRFTETRELTTADEIWFTEHRPVFTLGLNGDRSHVLDAGSIPVVPVDRGGQVTFHGPGQIMIYPLIDLRRARLGVRDLVTALEQSAIQALDEFGVAAASRKDAPGVYVSGRKIASVGLRIRRGASFHGMAFNVDVDLAPFARINPCGYADLDVTNCRREAVRAPREALQAALTRHLLPRLGRSADQGIVCATSEIPLHLR